MISAVRNKQPPGFYFDVWRCSKYFIKKFGGAPAAGSREVIRPGVLDLICDVPGFGCSWDTPVPLFREVLHSGVQMCTENSQNL